MESLQLRFTTFRKVLLIILIAAAFGTLHFFKIFHNGEKQYRVSDKIVVKTEVDISKLLLQHENLPRFVTLVVANHGHLEFVNNWIIGMERNLNETSRYLIACLDSKIYNELQARSIPSFLVSKFLSYSENEYETEEVTFATSSYNKLTNLKIAVVLKLMKDYNYGVLFTDADTVWLKREIPFLMWSRLYDVSKGENFDLYLSRDSISRPDYACTGLYAVRPTSFSINLFSNILSKKSSDNDQFILDNIYSNEMAAEDKRKIGFAPIEQFSNGQILKQVAGSGNSSQIDGIWTWHANYVVGKQAKMDLLKSVNAWYLT